MCAPHHIGKLKKKREKSREQVHRKKIESNQFESNKQSVVAYRDW